MTPEHTASAAYRIARSATWTDNLMELDDRLLLGDLLVDPRKKFARFYFDLAAVTVVRLKLKEIGRVVTRAKYPDRRAFLDQRGLHFRWRDGRGGLDLISQLRELTAGEKKAVSEELKTDGGVPVIPEHVNLYTLINAVTAAAHSATPARRLEMEGPRRRSSSSPRRSRVNT